MYSVRIAVGGCWTPRESHWGDWLGEVLDSLEKFWTPRKEKTQNKTKFPQQTFRIDVCIVFCSIFLQPETLLDPILGYLGGLNIREGWKRKSY